MIGDDIRARRERVVLDHFADEVAQDWDATLSTFPHPHYEIVPLGVVHDGDAEVRGYYHDTRVAFPDQHHEMIALRHSDDAVVVEFNLLGTARTPPRHRARPPPAAPRLRLLGGADADRHD